MKYGRVIVAAAMGYMCFSSSNAVTRIFASEGFVYPVVLALSNNNVCASNNVLVYEMKSPESLGGLAPRPIAYTVKCFSGNFGTSGESEVQIAINWEVVLGGRMNFISPTAPRCIPGNANGPLADISMRSKLRSCPFTSQYPGEAIGGFLDVNPDLLIENGYITDTSFAASIVPATLTQVYGLAVSPSLYRALQKSQGLQEDNIQAANQPSISSAQIASLINNNDYNDAKRLGPKFLVPNTAETNLTYCGSPKGEATQAIAEAYFLKNQIAVHDPVDFTAATSVVVNSGGGNTVTYRVAPDISSQEGCLMGPGFSFGFLSAALYTANSDVYSAPGSALYRFVKLSQTQFYEGVNEFRTSGAVKGNYDFVSEGAVYNPRGSSVIDLINWEMSYSMHRYYRRGMFANWNAADNQESRFGREFNPRGIYRSY